MSVYPDADTLLAGPLGGWLHEQVAVREDAKQKSNHRVLVGGGIAAALLLIGWLALSFSVELKLFATAATAMMVGVWSQAPKMEAAKRVKIGINEAIADALGLKYAHDLEPGRGFERAKAYRMLPSFDRDSFEDGWSGHYGGNFFVLHEAHLEERRGSGKNQRWVTVFRGAIITMGLSRDTHGTTLVQRAGKHRKFFGGVKDSIRLDGKELGHVDMVHPDFEDIFDIFSSDQVEARYLVHPAYVERLIQIERAFEGDDIRCLFDANELVVVINSGDMFESGSINASDDRARLQQTLSQFRTLADLALSLNERPRA